MSDDKDLELHPEDTKRIALIEDYKAVFSGIPGQNVLDDLIRVSGAFESTFNSDPLMMAYNDGMRSCVFNILSRLDQDVNTLRRNAMKQIREQLERKDDNYL